MVKVPVALTADAVEHLLKSLRSAYEHSAVRLPSEILVPRIVEKDRLFFDLALNPSVIRIVERVMGHDIHLVMNQGHVKPPNTDSHTAVHSDLFHLKGVPHHLSTLMVKCMYFLSRVGLGDGGMQVFPSSHASPHAENPPTAERFEPIYITAEPGDAIVFNGNLLHTATPNESERPRLTLTFSYAHTWMRVLQGHEFSARLRNMVATSGSLEAKQIFGLTTPYTTYAAASYNSTELERSSRDEDR